MAPSAAAALPSFDSLLEPTNEFKELVPIEYPEEEDPAEPVASANPVWIPPCCDVYTEDGVLYVWYKIVLQDGHLSPEACGLDSRGRVPKWTEHQDMELEEILGAEWHLGETWLRWGLAQGIAPGQPFLVRIAEPHYYRCSYEYDEWDCEWDAEVVKAMPRRPDQAARAWARAIQEIQRYRALRDEAAKKRMHRRITDHRAFMIQTDYYYAHGYDEMSPPDGIIVRLCSKTDGDYSPYPLEEGRDPDGRYGRAFRNLLRNVRQQYPQIPIEAVVNVSTRCIGITRYEWLTEFGSDQAPGVNRRHGYESPTEEWAMSFVAVYAVGPNGDVSLLGEAKNNHGFAPIVWQRLMVQYGLHPTGNPYDLTPAWHYEPLWELVGKGKLERGDELLLGATLDRVWIGRALVPELVKAMRAFHDRYIAPNDLVTTISDAADILDSWLASCPDDRGIAFHMCSANESFWEVYDRETEETRSYNVDRDPGGPGRHWELVLSPTDPV